MLDFKQVPASEIKIGDVLTPFPSDMKDFRVKSIETFIDSNKDFLIFRGESLTSKNECFKCYPTRIVGVSNGDSLIESVNKIKY